LTLANKKAVSIAVIITILLSGIIVYRIIANIMANQERAGRVSQGRIVTVQAAPVARRDIVPVFTFSANLEPVWQADLAAKIDGRIEALYVNEGDRVTAGMVVARLDTNELTAQVMQAEGNLYAAKASLEEAELDWQRYSALAEHGAVSRQALDTARIKRDLAKGQVQAAQGNLDLLRARLANATVTSPRDGVVINRYLQTGFYVQAGKPIVSVADTTEMLAKATVGEAQLTDIAVGTPVTVKVNALGDRTFNGVITRISPAAAMPARTFTAEVTIPNPSGELKAGMFAKVSVPGQVRKGVLAVPESALVMREDQKTVYVVTADNKVQQRVLEVGYVGDGWAEILGGLSEGEQIIVAGHNKIRDGANVKVSSAEGGDN